MNVNSYQRQLLQEWADRIRSQQSSGQNIEKWCLDNDISKDQFHYWKRKLKNFCFESQPPDIVQVSTLSAPTKCELLYKWYNTYSPYHTLFWLS